MLEILKILIFILWTSKDKIAKREREISVDSVTHNRVGVGVGYVVSNQITRRMLLIFIFSFDIDMFYTVASVLKLVCSIIGFRFMKILKFIVL